MELLVPGKSRQRSTPITACRTQRRSAPSLWKATLVANVRLCKCSQQKNRISNLLAVYAHCAQHLRKKIHKVFRICVLRALAIYAKFLVFDRSVLMKRRTLNWHQLQLTNRFILIHVPRYGAKNPYLYIHFFFRYQWIIKCECGP